MNQLCFICHTKLIYKLSSYDFLYHSTTKEFSIYKCPNCLLEQIYPLPGSEKISSFYPKTYYSYNIGSKSCKKDVYYLYTKFKDQLIHLSYKHPHLARFFKPFVRGVPVKKFGNGNFLDVGCGDGHTVSQMSSLGWNAFGFEIGSKTKVGNIYYNTSLEHTDFGKTKFSYIRVWHVLEHVLNPDTFIEELKNLLADDGKIIFALPNTKSIYAQLFGKFWSSRDTPRHLFNYNPTNLNMLFDKHGLEITELNYEALAGFIGSLMFIVNEHYKTRFNFVNSPLLFLFWPLDLTCNTLKLGDIITITVTKKEAEKQDKKR